ncbi:MAG: hypothetical protein CMJ18_26510 [Phycisphaeraceae bacterium]|nr:hypothetical protein [Phycisphaeraceae bacterium]
MTNVKWTLSAFVLLLCLSLPSTEAATDRGHAWIRSRPFTTAALVLGDKTFDAAQYGRVCNTLLAWKPRDSLFARAAAADMPWHGHAKPRRFNPGDDPERNVRFGNVMKDRIRQIQTTHAGGTGWLVWDEPQRTSMPIAADIAKWIRENFPEALVYTNGLPMGARRPSKYYGEEPPGGKYPYDQYVQDLVDIIQPDVVGFDLYPFKEDGGTGNQFPTVAITRRVALKAGIPYWAIVQAYRDEGRGYRMPSESDVRMQVFSLLAHGYTGITYFTYDPAQGPAMVDRERKAAPIYYHVAQLNHEVENVGQALRFLTSTDVRIVPCNGNSAPAHTVPWAPGAGGESRIEAISITDTAPAPWKDVMVGFFEDDDGRRYVMVTNLWHGKGAAAHERPITVRIRLANDVKHVGRLARETGRPELLVVRDGVLELTLPGGTGDLLRLGDATFPGLEP